MTTRFAKPDEHRIVTRLDGFVLAELDDDGPLIVPLDVAREMMKAMPIPDMAEIEAIMTRSTGHFDVKSCRERMLIRERMLQRQLR
jgi:hypothetical protein